MSPVQAATSPPEIFPFPPSSSLVPVEPLLASPKHSADASADPSALQAYAAADAKAEAIPVWRALLYDSS